VHIKNYLLQGITTPFLYYAERKNKACVWHCEDTDLLSISFLHYGDPKIWYTIPRMVIFTKWSTSSFRQIVQTNCATRTFWSLFQFLKVVASKFTSSFKRRMIARYISHSLKVLIANKQSFEKELNKFFLMFLLLSIFQMCNSDPAEAANIFRSDFVMTSSVFVSCQRRRLLMTSLVSTSSSSSCSQFERRQTFWSRIP